jgi:hypothetical protein
MTTITIDAAHSNAKAKMGMRGHDFVVELPDFDAELVFTCSTGGPWSSVSLAGGFGMALAEHARAHGDKLMDVAEMMSGNGGVQ